MAKHRFTNLYFTTTLSITLVLFMLGLFTTLLLLSHRVSRQLKENVTMSVVLSDSTTSGDVERMMNMFGKSSYVSACQYISKEGYTVFKKSNTSVIGPQAVSVLNRRIAPFQSRSLHEPLQ